MNKKVSSTFPSRRAAVAGLIGSAGTLALTSVSAQQPGTPGLSMRGASLSAGNSAWNIATASLEEAFEQGDRLFERRLFSSAYRVYRSIRDRMEVGEYSDGDEEKARVNISRAECLVELGRFESALELYKETSKLYLVDYKALTPFSLWEKSARAIIAWGDTYYRVNKPKLAIQYYNLILKDQATPTVDSWVYAEYMKPILSSVLTVIDKLKNRTDIGNSAPSSFVEVVVLLQLRLEQIDRGLNFLGLADDYLPILRFDYLYRLSKQFAQVASQANREFLSYLRSGEDLTVTYNEVEQAAALNNLALSVEIQAQESAKLEVDMAREAYQVSVGRRDAAASYQARYATRGWDLVVIESALAWSSATSRPYREQIQQSYAGLERLGITPRYQPQSVLISDLTARRATIAYDLERQRLADATAAAQSEVALSAAQITSSESRQRAAELRSSAARYRADAAEQNATEMRNREIGPDTYYRLASFTKELSETYLSRAIFTSLLMERAFELETGISQRRIQLSYGRVDSSTGTLPADALSSDIDQFLIDRINGGKSKIQPITVVISLSTEFPLQFQVLRQTGTMSFKTDLDRLRRRFPGAYNCRIKFAELIFDGLIGVSGPMGYLKSGSTSRMRRRDGSVREPSMMPEVLLLSDYRLRRDKALQDSVEEQLGVFENVGFDTHWELSLPKSENDFEFSRLSDVKLVIAMQAEFDADLKIKDDALNKTEKPEYETHLSLKHDFQPDLLYELHNLGQASFDIDKSKIPHNHVRPSIIRLALMFIKRDGSLLRLSVRFSKSGETAGLNELRKPDGRGFIHLEQGDGVLLSSPFIGSWTLVVRPEDNLGVSPGLGSSNIAELKDILDVLLVCRYSTIRPA